MTTIKPEHLDALLAGYEKPDDLLGENGLFQQLKKALLERALGAELSYHLGYQPLVAHPRSRAVGGRRHRTASSLPANYLDVKMIDRHRDQALARPGARRNDV